MTREERQEEASNSFDSGDWALIKAAPRFGKIKVTIDILRRLKPLKVLVCYPRKDIETGWRADIDKWGYEGEVVYSTHRSLAKMLDQTWDMVVIDEIHECSRNQLALVKKLKTPSLLGLTGTLTVSSEKEIYQTTGIVPCYEYTIEQAVAEGVLCDYTITVHKIPLDEQEKQKGKTEKRRFSDLVYTYDKLKLLQKDTFFIYIKQIQLIQNSVSKVQKTKDLLSSWKDDRVLVFCGTTEIADSLDCDVYHSKARERQTFEEFCSGTGKNNHLATIKMAQAGVTIKPIQKGLINYTSGNPEETAQKICRFLGWEYDNPGKKADIHIVSSTEPFELQRISTALSFFDNSKITYV